jgi:hypothetical protein
MVSVTNVIVGIFTTLGVLLVTGIILYLIAKAIGRWKPPAPKIFPGDDYMNYIGARCPSGWVYAGSVKAGNSDMDVCYNAFNVPVLNAEKCYDGDVSARVKMFPRVQDYAKYVKNNISQGARCTWVNNCGPPPDVKLPKGAPVNPAPAAWVGIAEHC